MKTKIKLEQLDVQSFVTDVDRLKGGAFTNFQQCGTPPDKWTDYAVCGTPPVSQGC